MEQARANRLLRVAAKALSDNTHRFASGKHLAAGGHQFRSLWTRDFAFAARGLLALKRYDVVRAQLALLFSKARPSDGLLPRTIDNRPPQLRVMLHSLAKLIPGWTPRLKLKDPLKAQHIDEHGSLSIDSNLLVLKTATDYVDKSGDRTFFETHKASLVRIFRFYDRYRQRDGLISQPAYADWQDSVKREGKSFYINMLYYVVARRLSRDPAFKVKRRELRALRKQIDARFFDAKSGLYRSLEKGPWTSLDGNLLAIDWGYLPARSRRAKKLYASLTRHRLFNSNGGLPGFNTTPDYPKGWAHLATRAARLTHYHDRVYWSWLMALSAKISHRMGDTKRAERVLGKLADNAQRDGTVVEVYRHEPALRPWSSWIYKSERPFSWGAGFVVDALTSTPFATKDRLDAWR